MKPKSSAEGVLQYPRQEIAVVEKCIREHDGQFTKQGLWSYLSEKMSQQTFDVILGFLLDRQRISAGGDGKIHLTPNPDQANKRSADRLASGKAAHQGDPQTKNRWSKREEANAITCFAFRNGFIEELHAGKSSQLLENPELSRITDAEMKKLMIEASQKMAELLRLKEEAPEEYWRLIASFNERYCKNWEK